MDENHVYMQPSHDTTVLQYTHYFGDFPQLKNRLLLNKGD